MKKIIVILLIFLFFVVLPAAAKIGTLPASFIPENVQWVLHFDMNKFTGTRLCNLILADEGDKVNKGIKKIYEKLKIDPMKDIDWFTIFGRGRNNNTAAWFCKGNFDKNYLISLLEKDLTRREIRYGKYTIYAWGPQFGVFVKDNLFLFGKNENMVKNVLDVVDGKKKNIRASGEMMSYFEGVPGSVFIRAVVEDISSIAGHRARTAILKKARMAFFIAQEKNGNLKLKLQLTAESAETAKSIEQLARGAIALGKLHQEGNGENQDPRWKLLEPLDISLKGNIVTARWSYPSEELVKLLHRGKKIFHH